MTKGILVVCLALVAGCGKLDAVMDSTVGMSDKMNVMAEGIRLQKLGEGLKMLFHEDNVKSPDLPLLMFPGGRLVADNATTKELIELAYLWNQEANQVAPDETKRASSEVKYSKEYVADFNRAKRVRLAALRVVASLTPQDKVETLIREQIDEGGRYETTAYIFLTARARYLNDILLRLDILDTEKMSNLGIMEEAADRAGYLKYIVNLPYKDRLKMEVLGQVNDEGNKDPDLMITDAFDVKEAQGTIADVKRKATSEFDPRWKNNPRYPAVKAKIEAL